MKRIIVFLAFSMVVAGCTKKSSSSGGTIYRGVLLHSICCQDVIESVGPNYLGQSWVDSNSTGYPVYAHVFKVSNPCQFSGHKVGDTLTFKVIPQPVQNCACCNVALLTPVASYPVQVVN